MLRNCRGSRAEALAYAAGLALWQRRMVEQADAVIVPSEFARERLRELGAPLPWERVHVLAPPVRAFARASSPACGGLARLRAGGLRAWRPEKGVDVAIEACRRRACRWWSPARAPSCERCDARAAGAEVRFVGRVDDARLAALRARGGAGAGALALGRDVRAGGGGGDGGRPAGGGQRVGALAELVGGEGVAPPGDVALLSDAVARPVG